MVAIYGEKVMKMGVQRWVARKFAEWLAERGYVVLDNAGAVMETDALVDRFCSEGKAESR